MMLLIDDTGHAPSITCLIGGCERVNLFFVARLMSLAHPSCSRALLQTMRITPAGGYRIPRATRRNHGH